MTKLFEGALEAFIDRAQPECLITGCGLRDGLAWSWGDLHRFGGLWIFHGASHATDWLSYDAPVRELQERALVLEPQATYFVRRGIWIISTTGTRLNPRAIAYLKGEKK